ncbi:HNH endonuclease [Bacillus sp. JJ634]
MKRNLEQEMLGKTFGKWTVIRRDYENVHKYNKKYDLWLCKCSCEKGTEKVVLGKALRGNTNKSCGCLLEEIRKEKRNKDKPIPPVFQEISKKKNVTILSAHYVWYGNVKLLCLTHSELGEYEYTWHGLKYSNSNGCKKCVQEIKANVARENVKKTFENIKKPRKYDLEKAIEIFASKNAVLLEDTFTSADIEMAFTCVKHPMEPQFISLRNALDKKRKNICRHCIVEGRKGENNPSWKGGITAKSQLIRLSDEYAKWKNGVLIKDFHTCQACGAYGKGVFLEAHHIKSFAYHPHLQFDVENGIILCEKCHNPRFKGSLHNIYGTFDVTEEELNAYLKMKREQTGIDIEELMKVKEEAFKKGGKQAANSFKRKLTDEQVLEIHKRLAEGEKQYNLAEEFNVTQATISRIKNAKLKDAFAHLNLQPIVRGKLTLEQIIQIKKRLQKGESPKNIAEDYPVSTATIKAIKLGNAWTKVKLDTEP